MKHLNTKIKMLFISGKLNEKQKDKVNKHLEKCKKCYRDILFLRIAAHSDTNKNTDTANYSINNNISNMIVSKALAKKLSGKYLLQQKKSNYEHQDIKMKKSIFPKPLITALATVLIVLAGFLFYKKSERAAPAEASNTPFAVITFVSGNASVLNTQQNKRPARIKTALKVGETIVTGKNSYLLFQIKNYGIFRVFENSKLQIDKEFINKNKGQLNLQSGKVYSNMFKLKKNQSFRVKTPSAVAAVRGTRFLVSSTMKRPKILVSNGKVEVSFKDKAEKKVMITAGQSVELKKKEIKIKKLDEIESLQMKKYALNKYQKDFVQKKKSQIQKIQKEIRQKEKELEKEIKVVKKKIWESLTPVEKLRSKGKVLTKIYLMDGSKIIGSVVHQDEKSLKLDTGNEVITLQKKDIQKREFMK